MLNKDVALLIAHATPFIRITDVQRVDWCRAMSNPSDSRIGPWKYMAKFDVLDRATWKRKGEVLYFVTDQTGALRLAGQSSGSLGWRWKEVPMSHVDTRAAMGRKALFHTTAWPSIEAGLAVEAAPFTVAAIFREDLERACRDIGGSLAAALHLPETPQQKLSYHVETWVCAHDFGAKPLWNKQKVAKQ